jgi:hypothetical protein
MRHGVIAKIAGRLPFFYGWVVVGVVFITMAFGVNARSAMLSPMLGRLMDRHGPCQVMELGVFAAAAGLMLATGATAPWHAHASLGILLGAGSICTGYTGEALFLPN